MLPDSDISEVDGDLTDYDIHRIMEALQTRQSKSVATCALSIKNLLAEIQQQLLDLMVKEKKAGRHHIYYEAPASLKDSSSESAKEQTQIPTIKSESSDHVDIPTDSADMKQEILTNNSVPIAGSFTKSVACHICNEVFLTKKALNQHLPSHSSIEEELKSDDNNSQNMSVNLENDELSDAAASSSNRSAANRKSVPKKKFSPAKLKETCTICGVQTLKNHMARHMLIHSGVKDFRCDICGQMFARKDKLKLHINKHNNGQLGLEGYKSDSQKVHTCRKCGFQSDNITEFKLHQKSHPSKNSFKCVECDKEFTCQSHLTQHNIKHKDEKPFVCEMCGVCFSREPNLARHIRSHVNPAPFRCKHCNKPYYRQNELVVHERTHTGEKPFMCEICGNGFSAAKYLKRHLFTHTGLKPYKCELCDRAFSRLENMRAHRKLHEKPSQPVGHLDTLTFQTSQNMDFPNYQPPPDAHFPAMTDHEYPNPHMVTGASETPDSQNVLT